MRDSMKIHADVSIECKNCGKRTTVPALKVGPGVKCQHCGAELVLNDAEYAAQAALLETAGHRDDVDFG